MPENSERSSKRALDPIDRVSEVLFGLIMVLTITGSLSVAEAGRNEVRTMLFGALGCNLAWGIIDGVLYVMGSLAEKGRNLFIFRAVRKATDPKEAQRRIAGAFFQIRQQQNKRVAALAVGVVGPGGNEPSPLP